MHSTLYVVEQYRRQKWRKCRNVWKYWMYGTPVRIWITSIKSKVWKIYVILSLIICVMLHTHTHTHTHNRLMALSPGLPGWASTRKLKPMWILLKQETVSGVGISWAICKSAPCSRQITTPAPHHSVFTGRMPFLPPNQQRDLWIWPF